MAECLNCISDNSDNSKSEDSNTDYEEFCENFTYSNDSTCWVCNGYYGPNFCEPLCGTCHAFLYPININNNERDEITKMSDDDDSGNDEPPYNGGSREKRLRREQFINENGMDVSDAIDGQDVDDDENNIIYLLNGVYENGFPDRIEPAPPRDVNHYINMLSMAQEEYIEKSNKSIESLPVEVLVSIFKHLDDISLWYVTEVCKKWKEIIEAHTPDQMWKKYTIERWPLFKQLNVKKWFDTYTELMSSCFCRTCLAHIILKKSLYDNINPLRNKRIRTVDIRASNIDQLDGIDAIPLDNQASYFQASILGPVGSPYEGGKFFLFVAIPPSYPMSPPTVRFLTKIVHPNISRHGDIGIDTITTNWSPALTLSKLLLSLQSLLTDPYTKVCMESELGQMYEYNRPKFEALARRWTWKYAMSEVLTP